MAELSFNKTGNAEGNADYHAVNLLLLAALWTFALWAYSRLPEQIPGHIGPSGVTRWDRRESGTWFLVPIIGSLNALLLYALAGVGEGGAAGVNTPQKKRLLALPREGQRYALKPMRRFMYGMVTWLLALMLFVQLAMYRTALAGGMGTGGARVLLLAILAFTAVPILMSVRLGRQISRRITEWEAMVPPEPLRQ